MTLREAVQVLEREHVGDFVYDIRDRVFDDEPGYSGSSWDHPRVKAWSEACKTLSAWLKENPA